MHIVLVACWTFAAVSDSQTEDALWANLSIEIGFCAAFLCTISALVAESPVQVQRWRILHMVTKVSPFLIGALLLVSNGEDLSLALTTAILIYLTARSIRNELLQLQASVLTPAAFNDEYPLASSEDPDPTQLVDKATDHKPSGRDLMVVLGKEFDSAVAAHDEDEALKHRQVVAMFVHFDVDGDSQLSREEYQQYLKVVGLWGGNRSVSGEKNSRYTKDRTFNGRPDQAGETNGYKLRRNGKKVRVKAGWIADCEEMGCTLEHGISCETFESRIYGKYRKDQLQADMACMPDRWKWQQANDEAAREQRKAKARAADLSTRRLCQRYTLGVCEYFGDFW